MLLSVVVGHCTCMSMVQVLKGGGGGAPYVPGSGVYMRVGMHRRGGGEPVEV